MTTAALTEPSPAISVTGLGKRFGGVTALDDVTIQFPSAQVTAVMGENGAGKSTLMTILAGLQPPDHGTVAIGGATVETFSPHELTDRHGVALVPQELVLCPDRTVAQNVLLGREPGRLPSRRAMNAATVKLFERLGVRIAPTIQVRRLPVAEQQLVLIARALARECRILILDEPTTALTPHETSRLMALLRQLRTDGVTIAYVSHRLPEVLALADHIHVLRDGRLVASFEAGNVTGSELVEAMVGRTLAERTVRPAPILCGATESPPRVVVHRLSVDTVVNDVSFTVGRGEVLGVAGLPDSGRSELVAALFGVVAGDADVHIDAAPVDLRSPRHAIACGVGYVPAERRAAGLLPDLSAVQNAMVMEIDSFSRLGFVKRSAIKRAGQARLRAHDVRGNINGRVLGLSGGNQQKVILSRWLSRHPRLLLLDDPTRGVDVAAKAEIHDRIAAAAATGTAVVMASSDLPELLNYSDRILVMHRGRIAGILDTRSTTESAVMALATDLAGSASTPDAALTISAGEAGRS